MSSDIEASTGSEDEQLKPMHEFDIATYWKDGTGYYFGENKRMKHTVIASSSAEALKKAFAIRDDKSPGYEYRVYGELLASRELSQPNAQKASTTNNNGSTPEEDV